MAGAEKLEEKILEEARSVADKNIRQAKDEAEKVLTAAKKEADEKSSGIIEKATREASEKKTRMIAAAELESRKMRLQTKQDVIEEAFKKALEKLNNLPQEQYINNLAGLISELAVNGEYEVVLPDNDTTKFGTALVEKVNTALKNKSVNAIVKLSFVPTAMKRGFILKQGNMEINNDFEAVLKARREELEADVVKALF